MHDFAYRAELLSRPLSKPPRMPHAAATVLSVRSLIATTVLGGVLALGSISPAQADGASGQTIGLTCVVCHGPQGKGTKSIPPLAGKSADQTYAALLAYKSGSRPSTVMDRHAKGYSDEELRAVSDYFASLPAK